MEISASNRFTSQGFSWASLNLRAERVNLRAEGSGSLGGSRACSPGNFEI